MSSPPNAANSQPGPSDNSADTYEPHIQLEPFTIDPMSCLTNSSAAMTVSVLAKEASDVLTCISELKDGDDAAPRRTKLLSDLTTLLVKITGLTASINNGVMKIATLHGLCMEKKGNNQGAVERPNENDPSQGSNLNGSAKRHRHILPKPSSSSNAST